ncbi:MAG TPA: imidazoleglycerol-phosphate dehydratase [Methanotrichaceae archaeon]|nr:imidazoleglycerol-phosphate dehydratase [Methanotrichaceae archaeon]
MRPGKAINNVHGAEASVSLDLDGSGKANLNSGSGFLDHMINSLARTSLMDIEARADGSTYHRTLALGGAMGRALDQSLGDKSGIHRYGFGAVPMDEALSEVALDFSGRAYLVVHGRFEGDTVGDLESQNVLVFLEQMANEARMTLHIRFYGQNDHHKAESIFKALGLALREAVRMEGTGIPSTKGVI